MLYLLFFWRNIESNWGLLLRNSIELILKTWKILILTFFTKTIAEQSSVIQYEWPIYHMKEKELYYHSLLLVLWSLFSFFQRFDIKSGFPVFWLTLYIISMQMYKLFLVLNTCFNSLELLLQFLLNLHILLNEWLNFFLICVSVSPAMKMKLFQTSK